jgi:hypothetical protein
LSYGNGIFLGVGSGFRFLSYDGSNWTTAASPPTLNPAGVAYGNEYSESSSNLTQWVFTGPSEYLSNGDGVPSCYAAVSGRSKPAREGRMKTSHFEGRIALCAVETAQRRDEYTQREPATFDFDVGSAWLVAPADCA